MRISIIIGAVLAVMLIFLSHFSNHPMSQDFISRVIFEFGYKILALFSFYLCCRYLTGTRRHELVERCGGKGSNGSIAIYCVTILCIGLIISFVK